MTNIFPFSEAQKNVHKQVNYLCIVLEVTVHGRGSISDGPQRQSTLLLHYNVSLLLCSYNIIILHIKILKSMCLSMVIHLVSSSRLQVKTEGS